MVYASFVRRCDVESEGPGEPQKCLLQGWNPEPVDDGASLLLGFDEPRRHQYGEVGRHLRLRHVEVLRQLPRGDGTAPEQFEDSAPSGIGQGLVGDDLPRGAPAAFPVKPGARVHEEVCGRLRFEPQPDAVPAAKPHEYRTKN